MSRLGQTTTAEALSYNDFLRLLTGLHNDGQYLWEAYCCISFYSACRISDVLSMTWREVLHNDCWSVMEQKTGKTRNIPINENMRQRVAQLYILLGSPDKRNPVLYNQQTQRAYTRKYVNEMLKRFRIQYRLPIKHFTSHSFRKTFGRYVYETMGRTPEALLLLSMILKHSSPQTTMVYLGIRQEEIDNIYDTITLTY